jgi:hypothetical protein
MAIPHTIATLYYAIMTNTEVLVKSYLQSGEDPNVDLSPAITTAATVATMKNDDATVRTAKRKQILLVDRSSRGAVSPLHVAVVQCYFTALESAELRNSAMNILKALVEVGANTSVATNNLLFCYSSHISWLQATTAPMTPCGLAVFLKQDNSGQYDEDLRRTTMDEVIQLLEAPSQKDSYASTTSPSVTVPKSVANAWKALLFSEKFSDVNFKCQDGTTFYAHKNVMAAASPYFSAAFEGPWGKQHEDGLWETSNPAPVMKVVLSFIYTGEVTPVQRVLDEHLEMMLAVASEYDLAELRAIIEERCARSLGSDNVKSMLQLAHFHGSSVLKQSCFDFVQENTAQVLTDPSMASLAFEDAELWAELAAAILSKVDGGKENLSQRAPKRLRSS